MAAILSGVSYPPPHRRSGVRDPLAAFVFSHRKADREEFPKLAKRLLGGVSFWGWRRVNAYKPEAALSWGESTNVAAGRLYARGGRSGALREPNVALLGCGSVGGAMAETLTRGGVDRLALFDPESFKPGNGCRHPLAGESYNLNKAKQLAKRLGSVNPLSAIRGFAVGVPLPELEQAAKSSQYHKARLALLDAELWIDCTGDNDALHWLSQQAHEHRVPLATIFLTFRAECLVVCLSGKQVPCKRVYKLLTRAIQDGSTPLPTTLFDPPPPEQEIIEGAGCWSPTFPATNSQINALVNSAVEVLENLLSRRRGCDGYAVVLRRRPPELNFSTLFQASPLIEMAWSATYR